MNKIMNNSNEDNILNVDLPFLDGDKSLRYKLKRSFSSKMSDYLKIEDHNIDDILVNKFTQVIDKYYKRIIYLFKNSF